MFGRRVLVFIAVLCGLGAASAAPLYPKQDCKAVIASASAFHQCYTDNLAAANRALNELYAQLMAQKVFYVGSRDRLRDVERAWIVYKDKECDYEYGAPPRSEDYWLAHADCEFA